MMECKRLTEKQFLQEWKKIVLYAMRSLGDESKFLAKDMMRYVHRYNEDGLYIFVGRIGGVLHLKFELESSCAFHFECDKSSLEVGTNYFTPKLGKRSLYELSCFINAAFDANSL